MDLSSASFERLLNWLHPDRDEAGREYERIRALLIRKFQSQGCSAPGDLADATIDRTARILTPETIENWVGKKERYFYRVAYNIGREDRDKGIPETQMPDGLEVSNPEKEDFEPQSQCLEKCLQTLSPTDRELIERYYFGQKAIKKQNRVELSIGLKTDLPKLRVRAFRIRTKLRKCIEKCLQEADKYDLRIG